MRETGLEQKIPGARSRTRTGMLFKAEDFKSSMYTISSPGQLILVLPPGIEPGSTVLQTAAMTTSAKVALG